MWSVRLEHVSKRYRKGEASYKHLGSELTDLGRRMVMRARGQGAFAKPGQFQNRLWFQAGAGDTQARQRVAWVTHLGKRPRHAALTQVNAFSQRVQ